MELGCSRLLLAISGLAVAISCDGVVHESSGEPRDGAVQHAGGNADGGGVAADAGHGLKEGDTSDDAVRDDGRDGSGGGPCDGVACGGFGDCVAASGVAACSCDPGYHAEGLTCVEDRDPCETIVCGAHATCDTGVCGCEAGYEGDPAAGCTAIATGVWNACDCDSRDDGPERTEDMFGGHDFYVRSWPVNGDNICLNDLLSELGMQWVTPDDDHIHARSFVSPRTGNKIVPVSVSVASSGAPKQPFQEVDGANDEYVFTGEEVPGETTRTWWQCYCPG